MGSSMFGDMRRAGYHVGLSKTQLKQEMYDILLQIPVGTKEIKEVIVFNLGIYGQMAATRDINEAWTAIKKKAAKEYPEKFDLDQRGSLIWNDVSKPTINRKVSAKILTKLIKLAEEEGCDVDEILLKMIVNYRKLVTNK